MGEPIAAGGDGAVWDRWNEVDRLFEAALDVPRAERERFLVRSCGADLELLRIVQELIEITDGSPEDLARPGPALLRAVWSPPEAGAAAPAPLAPGDRVGRYRLVAELGRGGMATVYEAERADGAFRHRVAVKVVRRGIDTDDVVHRFLAERQILSGLVHPNIARLLDGGATEDGRPYLVIDLVAGEPITTFADRRRLAVRDRLRLFLQVADAVHYAHQRLVVHRDLKPSNILVTADGQAKLLDFGIAKLLGPDAGDAVRTRAGVRPLTPQYASPEQLDGGTITTASDVYQLGILLHVLVVGSRPQQGTGTASGNTALTGDWRRPSQLLGRSAGARPSAEEGRDRAHLEAIAELRATTSDALRRALRGDLDTIVLTALRLEPERRYGTAEAMAADVRRHLEGLPISARPATAAYRVRKFVGRNRWVPPVAALVLVALAGFGVTRYRHERQLERERNEARAQAERAEQLKAFLVGLFGSADPYAPADPERGRAITVVEALALGADRARTELADRPMLRADLLSSIASVYESLDQREPALSLLDDVLDIRRRHEPTPGPEFAEELGRHASLLSLTGRPDSADTVFRRRLQLERELHGSGHARVADALIGYSNHLSNRGDHQRAFELRDEAVRILRAAAPAQRKQLADALGLIASSYRDVQRPADAQRAARESLEIHRELFGDEHPSTAIARVHVAQVAHELGDLDGAARLYREALPVLERTLGPEHRNTHASWNNLGIVLTDAQDYAGAEEVHRRILALRRRLSGGVDDHEVAGSLQNLAATLIRQRRFAEAESLSLHARDVYARTTPAGHFLRAFPLLTVAESRLLQGDGAGAERAARAAVDILRAALPAGHYATAAAECRLGAALAQLGRAREAEPLVTGALAVLETNEQTPARLRRECAAVRATAPASGNRAPRRRAGRRAA